MAREISIPPIHRQFLAVANHLFFEETQQNVPLYLLSGKCQTPCNKTSAVGGCHPAGCSNPSAIGGTNAAICAGLSAQGGNLPAMRSGFSASYFIYNKKN